MQTKKKDSMLRAVLAGHPNPGISTKRPDGTLALNFKSFNPPSVPLAQRECYGRNSLPSKYDVSFFGRSMRYRRV
jgi:hypothetical protein